MKYLSVIFLLFSVLLHAQVDFQKGYIIDNANKIIQCYIKNRDLQKSPIGITYKLSENSEIKTLPINQFKEFRIIDTDQFYKRYSTSEDIIGGIFKELSIEDNLIFLRVLVEGNSDLLEYYNKGNYYFFYEKEENIVYLEYKKYIDDNNKIRENAKFKKQLFDDFKCDNFTLRDYSKLRYTNTNLSDFFSEYNQCSGGDFINIHNKRTKIKLNFKVKAGLNLNSSLTNEDARSYEFNYDFLPFSGNIYDGQVERSYKGLEKYNTRNNFSFGVEFEMRLPFNQNNWSVFIAPNYQNISETNGYISFSEPNIADFEIESNLSFSHVQIPIGLRHYFDVSDRLEIYAHIDYILSKVLSSEQNTHITEEVISNRSYNFSSKDNRGQKSSSGGSLGIGLIFLEKYALEINYYMVNVNLKQDYQVNMKGFAINASYTIF